MAENLTLAQRLSLASLEVGGSLAADKKNSSAGAGYAYISADKAAAWCGQALARQMVSVIPSIIEHKIETVTYKRNDGKDGLRYDATVTLKIRVTDGNQTETTDWFGWWSSYADPSKTLQAAVTSGYKFFLLKLLNIGEGADPEDLDQQSGQLQQSTTEQKPAIEVTPELEKARRRFHAIGVELHGKNWDAKRHEIIEKATEGKATSTNDLNVEWLNYLADGLQKKLNAQLDAAAA